MAAFLDEGEGSVVSSEAGDCPAHELALLQDLAARLEALVQGDEGEIAVGRAMRSFGAPLARRPGAL